MERATPEEKLTEKEMKKKINNVDESRAKYYDFYTGQKWGHARITMSALILLIWISKSWQKHIVIC